MRTLVRWAARLYPAAWRARYAAEMEALLEDVRPGGGDLWDLVRGALIMQMTSVSFWKIVVGCTLAGSLAAGVVTMVRPNRFVSSAVMQARAAAPKAPGAVAVDPQVALQAALSRRSLAGIILRQNLYPEERKRYPMEDVIEQMRKDIRVRREDRAGAETFVVEFAYREAAPAQAAVREIVGALMEQSGQMEVLERATLPGGPTLLSAADRMRAIAGGGAAGLLAGLLCGTIWFLIGRGKTWSWKRVGAFAAAGMAVGVGYGWRIPDQYVSSAVVRAPAGALLALGDEGASKSLRAIILKHALYPEARKKLPMEDLVVLMRRDLSIQMARGSGGNRAYTIAFRYPDRYKAQMVTRDLVQVLSAAQENPVHVLDPASLPQAPVYPNRLVIAGLGILAGALLGLAASYLRRRAPAAA